MRATSPSLLGAVAVAVVATVSGCAAHQYVYRPEENATARIAGRPAAYYSIPPQAPRGDVRIATLGIAQLEARGDEHDRIHAMHVRMIVDNNTSPGAWQVDTRQQLGMIDGYGQSRPAFATSNAGRPPIATIPVRGTASIDLYYPLPANMQKASKIAQFDVLWTVQTAEGPVAERTSFERIELEPPPMPADYYAGGWWGGWGPGWYDPFWPDYGFAGAVVLPPAYYAQPIVTAPPAHRIR
jgi:hypothetical protein